MTVGLPSLATAAWLVDPATQRLLALLAEAGEEARVIGGAVRNALIGEPVADLDVATTAQPDEVVRRVTSAGFKAIPTGIEHGTVTVVVDGRAFEVTTLREDVATDGRRARVAFGRDWSVDARRRDFTMNALSVSADGRLYDPVGGYPDCIARRVRFIGDPERRIAEDYLRILRFFRFHARYGSGAPDRAGLAAVERRREGLRYLSAERIGQEMRKLVVAPGAAATVDLMSEAGVLTIVLAGVGCLPRFARFSGLSAALGERPAPALALAVLGMRITEDGERIAARLRLSNEERARLLAARALGACLGHELPDERTARRLIAESGAVAFRDGLWFAAAESPVPADRVKLGALLRFSESWEPPPFPVSGRDLAAHGHSPGPAMGRRLAALRAAWVASDFSLDRDSLLALDPDAAPDQAAEGCSAGGRSN